jgi:hypothetical protein
VLIFTPVRELFRVFIDLLRENKDYATLPVFGICIGVILLMMSPLFPSPFDIIFEIIGAVVLGYFLFLFLAVCGISVFIWMFISVWDDLARARSESGRAQPARDRRG